MSPPSRRNAPNPAANHPLPLDGKAFWRSHDNVLSEFSTIAGSVYSLLRIVAEPADRPCQQLVGAFWACEQQSKRLEGSAFSHAVLAQKRYPRACCALVRALEGLILKAFDIL